MLICRLIKSLNLSIDHHTLHSSISYNTPHIFLLKTILLPHGFVKYHAFLTITTLNLRCELFRPYGEEIVWMDAWAHLSVLYQRKKQINQHRELDASNRHRTQNWCFRIFQGHLLGKTKEVKGTDTSHFFNNESHSYLPSEAGALVSKTTHPVLDLTCSHSM